MDTANTNGANGGTTDNEVEVLEPCAPPQSPCRVSCLVVCGIFLFLYEVVVCGIFLFLYEVIPFVNMFL